jgi:tetratricopeptide (TPR) repeat protein
MSKIPDVLDPDKDTDLMALQALKYEDESPLGKANACKEDGNYCFKQKQYKKAISSYSAGIQLKCEDDNLMAVMYTNRATCHYNIGNYRSAILDCTHASKHDPTYVKCFYRAASACMELGRYQEAVQWCDRGLLSDPDNKQIQSIRTTAVKKHKAVERDKRKELKSSKKKLVEQEKLISAIKSRGVKMEGLKERTDVSSFMENLEQSRPHPSSGLVTLNDDDTLSWPVLFLYPEFGQSDYVQSFNENDIFIDQISTILSTPPPWDLKCQYRIDSVAIYFQDKQTDSLVKVSPEQNLRSVLSSERYTVTQGTPAFMLLNTNSNFFQTFLSKHS